MKTWIGKAALGTVLGLGLTLGAQATPVLYGVSLDGATSGSPGPSSLYTIDTTTGAGTLVGGLGYAVNALAVDPTTGILYGSTTSWSGAFNGLLRIDPTTGSATEIGPFGASFTSILGLTFNSAGELYGWHDPSADDPVRIDITTGAATTVGPGTGTGGQVLAFDAGDNLTLVQGDTVYDIDATTGVASFTKSLGFDPGSGGADFDPMTGLLWAARGFGRDVDSFIRITDIGASTFTDLDTDVSYLNALTFADVGVPEPATLGLMAVSLFGLLGARRKA